MRTSDLGVLVIGAGVSGLTSAILLAESGLRVRVWSAQRPEETTSVAAGAMWGPYLVEPVERVHRWSTRSLAELKQLASQDHSGVRLTPGIEASRSIESPPEWAGQLDGFQMCRPDELPDGFVTGWRFVTPLVDMPQYLVYLEIRLIAAGGEIELRQLSSLDEATEAAASSTS